MKNTKLRYTALAVSIMLLISAVVPVNVLGAAAGESTKTVVKVKPGVGKINVNGVNLPSEKPYFSGKTLYIPLRTVMEAFGADVIWLGNSSINILFKNVSAELTAGRQVYLQNQVEKKLSAPPAVKGRTVMVPSDFISSTFDITEMTNTATGEISFVLDNDGSLNDLSFLTGSLNKPKAGNSYFGWSLALPKGTRLASQTFNSKTVQFENDYHGLAIDVSVALTGGKSLEEYYNSILDNPYVELKGAELIDSSLSKDANQPFIELFYTDSYDEAVYHRVYIKNGYFFNVIVTSYDESDPDILKKDEFTAAMFASFSLNYKGGVSDTSDLSRISYGLSKYSNYITSENTGKKFESWEMSILPEWDLQASSGGSPYITEFGNGPGEYVSIETSPAEGKTSEETGKIIQNGYDLNFNPAYFSLKNSNTSEIAGVTAWSMLYEVKMGDTLYTYDERVLVSGGLMYDISFKTPSALYEKKKESFENMLKTFKPYTRDAEALSAEIVKYRFNNEKSRLGKDDRPVLSENKTFSWSIMLPGRWQKNNSISQSMETFYDPTSGGIIIIESVLKKADSAGQTDEEKFSSMYMVASMGLEPVKTESIQAKGQSVKMYRYRLDDKESDDYADVIYYILESQKCSYCYMYSIPDLTSSEANLKALADAWDSFTIVEESENK